MIKAGIPQIVVPGSEEKLKRQIRALEHLIKKDVRDQDKIIHQAALKELKKELEKY